MKEILNNTKTLQQLHNIIMNCNSDIDLSEWLFQVSYNAKNLYGTRCYTLAECHALVNSGAIKRACDYSLLPLIQGHKPRTYTRNQQGYFDWEFVEHYDTKRQNAPVSN